MVQPTPPATGTFYETDETGWLEATADLIRRGRVDEVDTASLVEFLTDMATRDRREVVSRLRVLLAHLLKWHFQPTHRSNSWRSSIRNQRLELQDTLESRTLRNHAESVFDAAFAAARRIAADETGLAVATFPTVSPWTLDEAVTDADLPG
ncbi:MAG: DUF29 domain-containing protein [Gemmataceae bacterium]|nr:DUF29 domain-containing protein [Gemmataceae bacterium]